MQKETITINIEKINRADWMRFRKRCLELGISASEGIRRIIRVAEIYMLPEKKRGIRQ